MKKIGLLFLIACYLLFVCGLGTPVLAAEEMSSESASYGCRSLDATTPLLGTEELIENAESVILYETKSDTLMYAWNADVQVEPASLSKIMTALVAIEKGNLADAVTVRADVLSSVPEEAISVGLQADEVLSLEELLYCLLVSSANDAAAVIADHVCGSQAVFVGEMNRYAEEVGCMDTRFTNALGLFDELQHTTARDMAKILSAAMKNEQFRTIFCTASYTVPATNKSEVRKLVTSNYLIEGNADEVEIYCDSRVTGGRTGVTSNGKRSIAVTAETNNLELVSIIIGAESELDDDGYSVAIFGGYQETSQLLDMGFVERQVAQILYENQSLIQQSVTNGDCDVVLGPDLSAFALLPLDVKPEDLTYRYSLNSADLQAPISKGDNLAKVQVWHDNLCVVQADLYAMNGVAVKQQTVVQSADTEKNTTGSGTVSTVIIIILVVIIAVLLGTRVAARMRHAAASKRSRRNSRNRRRSR